MPEMKTWTANGQTYEIVDAKARDHMSNTVNPHGVTLEQIGAAPATMVKSFADDHPSVVDMLNIDVAKRDRASGNMQPAHVSTEDASTLINSPVASGPFYAIRTVDVVPVGHVLVRLEELYPKHGRVWTAMYDVNSGWVNGDPNRGVWRVNRSQTRYCYTHGVILNDHSSGVRGIGTATITIEPEGLAKIDFVITISTSGRSDSQHDYHYGINRDQFVAIDSGIPYITPLTGGTITFYNQNGTLNTELTGYGGTFTGLDNFWQPCRVYQQNGEHGGLCGAWQQSMLTEGMRMVGTCYGTVQ
jgi:hypothetical protein